MNQRHVLAGRLGAHTSWANTEDRSARTAPARQKFLDRFERQVDPEGVLSPRDRGVRAEHARKAYFARLAMLSAKARARRRCAMSAIGDTANGTHTCDSNCTTCHGTKKPTK